jgi:phospholipid/cholesterol/gamma-HCH transport system substrate-binding protein
MSTQRQFLLGIFFLTALGLLGFYTLFLTDFQLFGEPVTMQVGFQDAHGLREGDPVMVKGLRQGRVKSLRYEPTAPDDHKILAILHLNEEVVLTGEARIVIKESTLLGGRQVDIFPGVQGGAPLEPPNDGYYRGFVEKNPIDALGSVGTMLSENSEAIKSILSNVDLIVTNAREGRGPIGRFLMDEEMADGLAASLEDLRQVTSDARQLTTDISAGHGVIGSLLNDEAMAESFRRMVTDLQTISSDVRSGQGLVGRLVYDDRLAIDVERAISSFRSFGERMENAEGILGKLLTDEDLAQVLVETLTNFNTASDDIAAVTKGVRNGEGSVGKLFSDDELYEEGLTAVKLLTRSLEDFREAAPISTFTGVLFSAF